MQYTTLSQNRHGLFFSTARFQNNDLGVGNFESKFSSFSLFVKEVITVGFIFFFYILLTVHLNIKYLFININQLGALNFIISLFQASTCFEDHVLIVRRANCIIQSLVLSHL